MATYAPHASTLSPLDWTYFERRVEVPDEVGWSGLMATILFNLLWLCPKLQAVEVMVLTLNNFLLWGIHVRSTRRRHCKHRR